MGIRAGPFSAGQEAWGAIQWRGSSTILTFLRPLCYPVNARNRLRQFPINARARKPDEPSNRLAERCRAGRGP
ncbi:hypothetical protein GCM10007937_61110 [Mesorhizobium albiziae]|nr:hypothetical protein GCM10007937_61110 [Mesorhizobium albiziae]